MSILIYQSPTDNPVLTLTKKNIAQYIFENGITTDVTINKYTMLGKDFIHMTYLTDNIHHIVINDVGARKIHLEIANQIFTGTVDIKLENNEIHLSSSTATVKIDKNSTIHICFDDPYIDHVLNRDRYPHYQCSVLYRVTRAMILRIIWILRWILDNI